MDKKCVFFISNGRLKINDNNTSTFAQSQSHSYTLMLNIYGSNKCIEIKVMTASLKSLPLKPGRLFQKQR